MKMNKTYQVAGHCFRMCGEQLCKAVEQIIGFRPFECEEGEPLFELTEGTDAPAMEQVQYTFSYGDVTGTFGRWEKGFLLTLKPEQEEAFYLWTEEGGKTVWLCGNWSLRLYRFALWVGYGRCSAYIIPHGKTVWQVFRHKFCRFYPAGSL